MTAGGGTLKLTAVKNMSMTTVLVETTDEQITQIIQALGDVNQTIQNMNQTLTNTSACVLHSYTWIHLGFAFLEIIMFSTLFIAMPYIMKIFRLWR